MRANIEPLYCDSFGRTWLKTSLLSKEGNSIYVRGHLSMTLDEIEHHIANMYIYPISEEECITKITLEELS